METPESGNETQNESKGAKGWFVLIAFSFCSIGNAMAWLTFAPVPSQTAKYFNITVNQVDLFSIIFMIVGIPVGILAIFLVDKIGLTVSIRISVWFNLLGTALRLSTLFFGETEENDWIPAPDWCYPVALFATAVVSISQAFILISPTKLAAQWFPSDQRLLANSIGSMANPVGIMLASILSPIIVKQPEDLKFSQIYFAIPSLLATLMSLFIKSEGIYPLLPELPMKQRLHILFNENRKNFLFIATLGAFGLAQFSTVLTLMVQFLCPHGYSNTFASSICASVIVGSGLLCSLLAAMAIDGTERHEMAVKLLMPVALLGSIAFSIAMMFENNEAWILVTCIVYGAAGLCSYPIACELTVETTYPVGEATSTGIFVMVGQLLAALFVVISALFPTGYQPDSTTCDPADQGQNLMPFILGINGIMVVGLPFFIYFYKCEYKRKKANEVDEVEYIAQL